MSLQTKLLLVSFLFPAFLILLFYHYAASRTILNTQHSIDFQKSFRIKSNYSDFQSNPTKNWDLSPEAKLELNQLSHLSVGFNSFESSKMFNLRVFPPCPKPDFFQGDPLSGHCEGKYSEIFESGPDAEEHYAGENLTFPLVRLKTDVVALNNLSEYGTIQCQNHEKRAFLRNVFSSRVARRATEAAEKMKRKYQKKETSKPLTVVFLVFDSVSRQSFYRNLRKTVKLLNQTSSNTTSLYYIYDFLGNQIHGWKTKPNMVPFLYGESEKTASERFNKQSIEEISEYLLENQQNRSLWTFFKDRGFVTMFLNDVVSNSLNKYSGTTILADHHVGNFWSMAKEHFNYNQLSEDIQCIGSFFPHHYSLKYLQDFTKNYRNFNKFAYVHINVAHEATGTRLKILDKDLEDFCKGLMEQSEGSDLVLVLASDHGRFKAEYVTLEGMAERAIPAHFLVGSKEMMDRLGFHQNLKVNTQRLVSRFDWHKSFKALAFAPYTNLTSVSKELKLIHTESPAVSLFHSQVGEDRKCSDIGVSESLCFDLSFQKVSVKNWGKSSRFKFYIRESLKNINLYLKESEDSDCSSVNLEKIVTIDALYRKPVTETSVVHYLFHLQLGVNANILVHGSYSSAKHFGNKHRVLFKYTSIKPDYLKLQGKENSYSLAISKIWSYTRLDLIRTTDKNDAKTCLERRFFHYNYILGNQQENCRKTCENLKLVCIPSKFLDGFLRFQSENFQNITRIGNLGSLEIVGNSLLVGRSEMCGKTETQGQRICHCVNPELVDDEEGSVKYW